MKDMRNGSEPNIDDFVNYEAEYRPHIKKAVVAGGHMTGLCPFHNDRNNSFSVDLKTGQWHCFSEEIGGNFLDFYGKIHGCDTKEAYQEILKQYGKDEEEKPEDKSYTLEQYAKDKHLPKKWLEEFCSLTTETERKTGVSYMKIPYFGEDSKPTTFRKRYAHKDFRWKYGSKGKIGLYGEWRMPMMRSGDSLILVEGESDTQSLWYMGLAALGVPGASMFKVDHVPMLKDMKKLYLHHEKDGGGDTFIRKTLDGLRRGGFEGKVFTFTCGAKEGCKDPSDFLIKLGKDEAREEILKLLKSAKEVDLDEPEEIPVAIKGAPVNLRTPAWWKYDETGIYKIDPKTYEETMVCGTPILLTRRIKSLDTDEEKMEIAFMRTERKGKVWRTAILPRSVIFTTKGTSILSDLGCMVTSENAKPVIRFLSALEIENDDIIDWAESTSTFGWQPGKRFIPGVGEDIVLDIDSTQASVAAAYHTNGTFEGWKATMQAHRDKNKFRFILAAAFAAPLLKILHQRTFFVYNWGDARGGKTAALKAALSVWGEPDGLMMNFNTTQVGLERTAAFFSDLPLGIDERQAAGSGQYAQSKLESLVYMIGEGKGKTRGAKDGGVQRVNRWRTIALATGEEPITTGSSQTGVGTRVLEIYRGPFETEAEAGQMHQDSSINCGWAGPEFIRHLTEVPEETLIEKYKEMADYVKSIGKGKAGSHVASVAVIAFADALADEWIFEHKTSNFEENSQKTDGKVQKTEQMTLNTSAFSISLKSWEKAKEMAAEIMKEQMSAASGDVNQNATDFLVDWVNSNQQYFGEDAIGACLGMMSQDNKVAYIYASALNNALKREGFNERKTKKYLAEKGLITAIPRKDNSGETYSITKFFNGKNQRFVEFFLDKASGIDDEDDDGGFVPLPADAEDELPFK
jgi:hypothetical protein